MKRIKISVIPFLAAGLLQAQISVSGEINPYVMTRTINSSQINLPFRLLSLDIGYSFEQFDLKTNSAIEHRIKTNKSQYDLRELYFAFYPEWGEVKLGKQIHSWGAADAINPTNNLNPYDYYYMFKVGAGTKVGVFSLSSTYYSDSFQIEIIVNPYFNKNRIPYDEDDFPLAPDNEPVIRYSPNEEVEVGLKLQTSLTNSDISLYFFSGNDRSPSLYTGIISAESSTDLAMDLGYRKTTMLGSDYVTFVGDFTVRAEGAFYNTKTDPKNNVESGSNIFVFTEDVIYSQYVLQLEYTTQNDLMLSGQFIGSNIITEDRKWLKSGNEISSSSMIIPEFSPGMGTPFAMFSDKALLISSSGVLMDDQIDIQGSVMLNLENSGSFLSFGVGYSPVLNWKLELATTQFSGNGKLQDPFTLMEDFSHVRIGLLYNF